MLGPTGRLLQGLAALGIALAAHPAWAEAPEPNAPAPRAVTHDPAAAEVLFRAGRQLLQEGRLEEALAKFEESYRLDPTAGALFNQGECRYRQGKTASAWALYQQAATLADVQGKPDIYELALQRQRELESDLSYVTLHVAKPVPGLEVKRDGVLVGPAQFDVSIPVDPGRHIITAQAQGYESIQIAVVVQEKHDRQTVNVPALKEQPISQVASIAPQPKPTPLAASPSATLPRSEPSTKPAGSPLPWVLGGVGAASVVAGSVSGILALRENDYAKDHCPTRVNCSPNVLQAQGRRDTESAIAQVTIPVGILALGGAATWLLLTPRTTPSEDSHRVSFVTFTNGRDATCWMTGAF
jgi:hypothetical protein